MRTCLGVLPCLLLAALATGCATLSPPRPAALDRRGIAERAPADDEAPNPFAEVGGASYYAHRFDGRRTASGQRYDEHRLTAAHRTLPFGTRVRVTNLGNGRSVTVTVNDRGPFRHDRVIDVSWRAARALGFVGQGTARVSLEVLAAAAEAGD